MLVELSVIARNGE